jgi:hypothetical protein
LIGDKIKDSEPRNFTPFNFRDSSGKPSLGNIDFISFSVNWQRFCFVGNVECTVRYNKQHQLKLYIFSK